VIQVKRARSNAGEPRQSEQKTNLLGESVVETNQRQLLLHAQRHSNCTYTMAASHANRVREAPIWGEKQSKRLVPGLEGGVGATGFLGSGILAGAGAEDAGFFAEACMVAQRIKIER
jgi:hypothetical protein